MVSPLLVRSLGRSCLLQAPIVKLIVVPRPVIVLVDSLTGKTLVEVP